LAERNNQAVITAGSAVFIKAQNGAENDTFGTLQVKALTSFAACAPTSSSKARRVCGAFAVLVNGVKIGVS